PRTSSSLRTEISPSGKFDKVTLPSVSPSTFAIFSASRMLALPLKTLSLLLLFMVRPRMKIWRALGHRPPYGRVCAALNPQRPLPDGERDQPPALWRDRDWPVNGRLWSRSNFPPAQTVDGESNNS